MELALVRLLVVAPRGQHLGPEERGRADVADIKKLAYRLGCAQSRRWRRSVARFYLKSRSLPDNEQFSARRSALETAGQLDTLPLLDGCATTLLCSCLFRNSGAEAG